ncbi:MAG: carboxypeptidase regulatory-like domain-containing protein [Bacteroidales bacterium]|nr:carboxypeptidase regulatory-like domain-containing protein [Bacteroidales bacterium]
MKNVQKISLLIIIILSTILSFSQAKGAIEGQVRDSISAEPIAYATVTLDGIRNENKFTYTTITDELGYFRFLGVKPGIYELSAYADSYYPSNQITIVIPGTITYVEILLLKIAPILVMAIPCHEEITLLWEPIPEAPRGENKTGHFNFEGGACCDTWTIYIGGATWSSIDLEANDEIAIFDGETIVGWIELSQVCTPENWFENALPAFSILHTGPGYTPGNAYSFIAWDESEQVESDYFNIIMSDPYGGAWTQNVFPPGDGQYSMIELRFNYIMLETNPTSFIQKLEINGTIQDYLDINNVGGDTLLWNIEVIYLENTDSISSSKNENWLAVNPLEGILEQGQTEIVTLDFNAENLEEGIYYANIVLFSNDPINPEVIIPIIMIVGEPLQHFTFEGGNPADPVWTINLAKGEFDYINLQPLDEIAIFDGDLMVGAFMLNEVLTMENAFENALIAYSTLNSQSGYQHGNPYRFKCWDASEDIETDFFYINLLDPYGDAYTGDVFPIGENDYSIAETDFLSTIVLPYNLSEGYQFISSNLEQMDSDMAIILSEILNDNLDFVRNTQGQMLRKIGDVWVNGIGDWIIEEAYLIKMYNDDSFTIDGIYTDPETPISLTEGYQLVSFLPFGPVEALDAFQSIIGENLDFIRNSQGYILHKIGPNWINGIGSCFPKEGYLIKMNFDDTLVFSTIHACGQPLIDTRDQQIYNTVEIGNQCWFAENINIGIKVNANIIQANNSLIEKYCYDNDPANCELYGGLYQWDEMMQFSTNTQGICPDGWHLPTDAEWFEMESYLDTSINDPELTGWRGTDCGVKMLQGGSSGFEGLLSGYKDYDSEEFLMIGERTYFRSTSIVSYKTSYFWYRMLENSNLQVYRNSASKYYGFSVRCLRDEITKTFIPSSNLSFEDCGNSKHFNQNFYSPIYFDINGGNPQEPVWTIYFEKGILNVGDEIAVFDGEILAGSGIIISKNIFENPIPVFSNLYKTGNIPRIKVWDKSENKEYILKDYTFSNPYGDAWTENVFPLEDGEYSLLNFSTTHISDGDENNDISIYPNPTTGMITIGNLEGFKNLTDLEITNIAGKIVLQLKINNYQSKIEIDLSFLEKGVYFINISGSNYNTIKKIVMQ